MTEQLKEAIEYFQDKIKKMSFDDWFISDDVLHIETLIQYASECQSLKELLDFETGCVIREKKQNETLRREIAGYREVLQGVREAMEQVLDDANYIDKDGKVYIAPNRQTGGCMCHAAALMLIESLATLYAVLSEGEKKK